MVSNYGTGEESWESLGLQGDQTCQCQRKLVLNIHWKDSSWSWSSNPLGTWCEESTHWQRPWCWERSRARVEGGNRRWDGWMASLTQRTWVWASSKYSEGQGSLVCFSPWGRKELDMPEQVSNNEDYGVNGMIKRIKRPETWMCNFIGIDDSLFFKSPHPILLLILCVCLIISTYLSTNNHIISYLD